MYVKTTGNFVVTCVCLPWLLVTYFHLPKSGMILLIKELCCVGNYLLVIWIWLSVIIIHWCLYKGGWYSKSLSIFLSPRWVPLLCPLFFHAFFFNIFCKLFLPSCTWSFQWPFIQPCNFCDYLIKFGGIVTFVSWTLYTPYLVRKMWKWYIYIYNL